MKRQNIRETFSQAKFRQTNSNSSSLRILIPVRAAGPIIGKGGEIIKKLRTEYSVRLHIVGSKGPERVFYLDGEIRSICGCLRSLFPRLLEFMNAKNTDKLILFTKHTSEDVESQNAKEPDAGQLLDAKILIHSSQVGAVIGRRGDTIKQLQKENHMNFIKIYRVVTPESTDRLVQIIGLPDDVCNCIEKIMEILKSAPIRGPKINYNTDSNESAPTSIQAGHSRRPISSNLPLPGVPGSNPRNPRGDSFRNTVARGQGQRFRLPEMPPKSGANTTTSSHLLHKNVSKIARSTSGRPFDPSFSESFAESYIFEDNYDFENFEFDVYEPDNYEDEVYEPHFIEDEIYEEHNYEDDFAFFEDELLADENFFEEDYSCLDDPYLDE